MKHTKSASVTGEKKKECPHTNLYAQAVFRDDNNGEAFLWQECADCHKDFLLIGVTDFEVV